jgi:hypothetical protein
VSFSSGSNSYPTGPVSVGTKWVQNGYQKEVVAVGMGIATIRTTKASLPAVSPTPTPTPTPSVVTGIDPSVYANALYGKVITVSALGKARIGQNAGPVFGPYMSNGFASFAVSFGYFLPVDGSRVLFEITMDGKIVWSHPTGTADISAGTFHGETFTARFYQGNLTQAIDPLATARFGSEATALRPQGVIYFQGLSLAAFGGKLPFIAAVIGDTTDGAVPGDGLFVGDILERFGHSPFVGLTSAEFETTGIMENVQGFIWSEEASFLDLLRNATKAHKSFNLIQNDKLRVNDRGALVIPDLVIDRDNIVGSSGVTYGRQEQNVVPRELEIVTIVVEADYLLMPHKAQTPRFPVPVTSSVGKESFQWPVVASSDYGQALVTFAKYAEEAARKTVSFLATAFAYEIEPGDLIQLRDVFDGTETETFSVIQTEHNEDYTVAITAESMLKCAPPSEGAAEFVQDYNVEFATSATHTIPNADLGVAHANRRTVVTLSCRTQGTDFNSNIASVTINGVGATEVVQASHASIGALSAVWFAHTPAGAVGDIVVTLDVGEMQQMLVGVYRAVSGTFAVDDSEAQTSTGAGVLSTSLAVTANGLAVMAAQCRNGADHGVDGVIVDAIYVNDLETTGSRSTGSLAPGSSGSLDISIDPGAVDQNTLAVASFTL